MARRFFLPLFLVVTLALLVSESIVAQVPSGTKKPDDAWQTLNFPELGDHLKQLTDDERMEQIRDWCLISSLMIVNEQDRSLTDLLYDFTPIRADYFGRLQGREAGETRSRLIGGDRLLIVGPEGLAKNSIVLGRSADKFRAIYGMEPSELVIFEYRYEANADHAYVHFSTEISGHSLYTPESGYFETKITRLEDLEAFLLRNLDLVYVAKEVNGFKVGGRQFPRKVPTLLKTEDIATLVQGDANLPETIRQRLQLRGLQREYWNLVDQEFKRHLSEDTLTGAQANISDFEKLRQRIVLSNPYGDFENHVISESVRINPPALGFSLDPRVNYLAIATDFDAALSKRDARFEQWLTNYIRHRTRQEQELVSRAEKPNVVKTNAVEEDRKTKELPEQGFDSLLGLKKSNPSPEPNLESQRSAADRNIDTITEKIEVANQIELAQAALRARRSLLQSIAQDLRNQKVESLLRLEGYLASTLVGTAIGPGSPSYMIQDLQTVLKDTGYDVPNTGTYGPKTRDAIKRFQQDAGLKVTGAAGPETWKALLSQDRSVAVKFDALRFLLIGLEQKNNYQCARYDGLLQNTRVGMTLFYTDLMMKLWSFNYKGAAPTVSGFVPETAFNISPIYMQETLRHSSTRVWLGPKSDGFEFDRSGQVLAFAPVATRIFDASSSPLFPGREVQANYGADRFSYWWNNHFDQVADYEPQYHRLNELMKWSIVLNWLQQAGYAILNRLKTESVPRNYKFDDWIVSEPSLRVKIALPFMHKAPPTETTECLSLIESDPFINTDYISWMYGGAILANEKGVSDALANGAAKQQVRPANRRPGMNYVESRTDNANYHLVQLDGRTYDIKPSTGTVLLASDPRVRLDGSDTQLRTTSPLQFKIEGDSSAVSYDVSVDRTSLVQWGAKRDATSNQITLHLKEGPLSQAAHALLDQDNNSRSADSKTSDQIVLEDERILVRANEKSPWTLVKQLGENDVADRKPMLVVASGETPIRVEPVQAAELDLILKAYGWGGLSVLQTGEASDEVVFELLKTEPEGPNRDLELIGAFGTEHLTASASALYWQRSNTLLPDELKRANQLRDAWKKSGLTAVVTASNTVHGNFSYFQKGSDSSVLCATSGLNIDPNLRSAIESALPSARSDFSGVLVHDDPKIKMALNQDGILHVTNHLSQSEIATLGQVLQLLASRPEIVPALRQLNAIDQADLDVMSTLPKERWNTFAEFRSIESVPQSYALADLHITEHSPQVMVKTGSTISFHDLDAGNYVEARAYIAKIYTGEINPTITEFISSTAPLMKSLEQLVTSAKADTIITVEDGPPTAAQLWAIHGGDPKIHFVFDQTNIKNSLANEQTVPEARLDGAVFVSSVSLEELQDAKFASLKDSFDQMRQRLVPMVTAATVYDFIAVLADPDAKQVTILVRTEHEGLVFSDQWVSYDDIREALSMLGTHKELLHLISNGGADLIKLFADSGQFDRVVYSEFNEGDIKSLRTALGNASAFFSSFTTSSVQVSAAEYSAIVQDYPDIRVRLDSASREEGTNRILDLTALALSTDPNKPLLPDDVEEMFRAHVVLQGTPQTRSIDSIFSEIGKGHLGDAQTSPDTQKVRDLLRAMPTLKVQLDNPETGLFIINSKDA